MHKESYAFMQSAHHRSVVGSTLDDPDFNAGFQFFILKKLKGNPNPRLLDFV
jgi:hypothetical protein